MMIDLNKVDKLLMSLITCQRCSVQKVLEKSELIIYIYVLCIVYCSYAVYTNFNIKILMEYEKNFSFMAITVSMANKINLVL